MDFVQASNQTMQIFFLFSRREQLYTGGEVTDDEKMYTK